MPAIPSHSDEVHAENWAGSIAIVLTLAAQSNSSPTLPPPIHALIPRHSFLHVALEDAVRRLYKFAPPTFLGLTGGIGGGLRLRAEEPEAGSMYGDDDDENENAQQGKTPIISLKKEEDIAYPVCWFEDEETQTALRWHVFAGVLFDLKENHPGSPWRLRLHFSSYPTNQILSLESGDVLNHVRAVFKNSLKQAMCLHYGNSKPALNLTKESHGKIWDALRTANYHLYKQAHTNLPKQNSMRVPVRVLVNSEPPIQKPCLASERLTLGDVLHEAVPQHFERTRAKDSSVIDWRIAGLSKPMLEFPVQNYWLNLAHPDHFLYIIVLTS